MPAAQAQAADITGAGATFPYPIYSKWFAEYNKLHANIQLNYQSIGSGGGIRQVTNQTVFFGATDGPMNEEQLKAARDTLGHDFWSYGVAGNEATIDTFLRHHHSQGLSTRRLSVDEVFHPSTYESFAI